VLDAASPSWPTGSMAARGGCASLLIALFLVAGCNASGSGGHSSSAASEASVVAVGVPASRSGPDPSRQMRTPGASTAPVPEWVHRCLNGAGTSSRFVGMDVTLAKQTAARRGVGLVILGQAGKCYPLPLEQLSGETLVFLDKRSRIVATRRLHR
jgi:hypothetical protein